MIRIPSFLEHSKGFLPILYFRRIPSGLMMSTLAQGCPRNWFWWDHCFGSDNSSAVTATVFECRNPCSFSERSGPVNTPYRQLFESPVHAVLLFPGLVSFDLTNDRVFHSMALERVGDDTLQRQHSSRNPFPSRTVGIHCRILPHERRVAVFSRLHGLPISARGYGGGLVSIFKSVFELSHLPLYFGSRLNRKLYLTLWWPQVVLSHQHNLIDKNSQLRGH